MDWSRRIKLIVRWSLVTAAATALFWFVWRIVVGEVPAVASIKITTSWTVELPVAVSRWFDFLIWPIWSSLFILLFTAGTSEDENSQFRFFVGLFYGLVYGFCYGLIYGLVGGLFIAGFAFGIRKLFSLELWRTVGRWLIAKKE